MRNMQESTPVRFLRTLMSSVKEFKSSLEGASTVIPYGNKMCRACGEHIHPIRDINAHLVCPFCGHILDEAV